MKWNAWFVGGGVTVLLLAPFFIVHAQTENRAPFAIAKMSINGGSYSSDITVTQGVPVAVAVSAGEHGSRGSFDPDGWATPLKGVSPGGKIEWNSDLNLGEASFETLFTNPEKPISADMDLGQKTFTLSPGKYTYKLLKITDAAGSVSNIGTVNVTIVANTAPPKNRAPFAIAKMSINGGAYSSKVTVIQGAPVSIRITAGEKGKKGSFDPDGWDKEAWGVSKGGTIEWNSDLNLGDPTFEKTFKNPKFPSSADMNLGKKTFTLAPGDYTYKLLKITDADGLVSNIGTVEVTVLPNDTPIFSSPSMSKIITQGQKIPIVLSGKGKKLACGSWTVRTPKGRVFNLSGFYFMSEKMPGNLAVCLRKLP